MAEPILSPAELGLVTALVQAVPAVGTWIGGLIAGDDRDPEATRRVSEILPERSASEAAAEELREAHRSGG